MTPGTIALLLSIVSVIEIPAKTISGILFDLKWIKYRRSTLLGILGIVMGASFGIVPFAADFYVFIILWCTYILFMYMFHTQTYTVMSDVVGPENLNSAMGLARLTMGLGTIIGTTTLGNYI